MFKLLNDIRSFLNLYKMIEPGDRVLVMVSNDAKSIWLGQLAMNVIIENGNETVMLIMNPMEFASQEPPSCVALAMKNVDSIIPVSERRLIVGPHTKAREEASAAGAKICGLSIDRLKQTASPEDIRLVVERTEALAKMLAQANTARVTTSAGTDITMSITGRESLAAHCMGYQRGMAEYGEGAIAPVEDTVEGTIVIDVEVRGWGYLLSEPIRLTVKKGKVVKVSGGKEDVEKLEEIFANHKNADTICELGIGSSHLIPLPLEGKRGDDVCKIGTAHFGLGMNEDMGGQTVSDVHFDVLMDNAVVELDGRTILKDGKLSL